MRSLLVLLSLLLLVLAGLVACEAITSDWTLMRYQALVAFGLAAFVASAATVPQFNRGE
jgi:hypothetical protein